MEKRADYTKMKEGSLKTMLCLIRNIPERKEGLSEWYKREIAKIYCYLGYGVTKLK